MEKYSTAEAFPDTSSVFPEERYLCPEKLIEGNPIHQVIINPQVGRVHVLSTPEELSHYCDNICDHVQECTKEIQDRVFTLINSFCHSN